MYQIKLKTKLIIVNSLDELLDTINSEKLYSPIKSLLNVNVELVIHRLSNKKILTTKYIKRELFRGIFKSNNRLQKLFWQERGFDDLETIQFISKLQVENSLKFKKKKQETPQNYSGYTSSQLGYWLNQGYNLEDAKNKHQERQNTFTKEKCIIKYGEVDGLIRWQERQGKWIKSLHANKNLQLGYSLVSQELFDLILEQYSEYEKDFIFYAQKNKEMMLIENEYEFYFYDFCDLKRKKLIEFNGDRFHGNPEKFKEDDKPHPFYKKITAQELWTKDEIKTNVAIKNGYEVLVIWEKDYRVNKEIELNKCLKFLHLKND